jgi:hypothetical protein
MKKAPRMNGLLTKPATQAVKAVKSAVAGEAAWLSRRQEM